MAAQPLDRLEAHLLQRPLCATIPVFVRLLLLLTLGLLPLDIARRAPAASPAVVHRGVFARIAVVVCVIAPAAARAHRAAVPEVDARAAHGVRGIRAVRGVCPAMRRELRLLRLHDLVHNLARCLTASLSQLGRMTGGVGKSPSRGLLDPGRLQAPTCGRIEGGGSACRMCRRCVDGALTGAEEGRADALLVEAVLDDQARRMRANPTLVGHGDRPQWHLRFHPIGPQFDLPTSVAILPELF
mmetsp:Transcript_23278/g.67372  ORF Transcript_23278/g.67372 Transcript_23278/m.67372 type:complete len:242 (+) Transcript_23278:3073-3798(+)